MSPRIYRSCLMPLMVLTIAGTTLPAHAELLGTASTNGVSPFSPREGDSPYNAPSNTMASAADTAAATVPTTAPSSVPTSLPFTAPVPQGMAGMMPMKKTKTAALGI